jgi:hypothetical protein
MEINITCVFNTINPASYSASRMELGDDAGAITWANAMDAAPRILKSADQLQAFRDHMREFGAWDDVEIAAWTAHECNALFLQLISGDIRESMHLDKKPVDWQAYEADENAVHHIFKGSDNKIYYYLGT